MSSAMWGTFAGQDADPARSRSDKVRPPLAESNGRTMSRRPTRILSGPPPWVVRRPEA